jgi:hypothetical protein
MYGGAELGTELHNCLSKSLHVGELSAPGACLFTHSKIHPLLHFTGDLVGPRAGLDATGKREISYLLQKLNPSFSNPVANWTFFVLLLLLLLLLLLFTELRNALLLDTGDFIY